MKLLVWDFDGTLGHREGRFSGACREVLQEHAPDLEFDVGPISAALQTGFPWHTPELVHPHLSDPATWWRNLEPVFARAFQAAGLDSPIAHRLAPLVRHRYLSPSSWTVFPDSHIALASLSAAGWTHILLSNHVPELPWLLDQLGLGSYFHRIANSAKTGFEKPHPKAFAAAVEGLESRETTWMIGDSLRADIEGARAVGWNGILVRYPLPAPLGVIAFGTLTEAAEFLKTPPALADR